jgi:lipopolysaccharide/colanic/teichoic acid biosynthesis glycosyltransferase
MKNSGALVMRAFDLVLALLLLLPGLVIFVLLVPFQLIFFRRLFHVSRRGGRNGRFFMHIKLKSMHERAPGSAGDGSSESSGDKSGGGRAHLEAERIPRWGRFLRASHLDELPELVFILTGRESFVGPRPLLPPHLALVDSPWRRRLKPGWTGLSQIFLRKKGILPSRIQRRLDARLGKDLSPALYLKILAATAGAFFSGPGQAEPGPTVAAYREAIQRGERESNQI